MARPRNYSKTHKPSQNRTHMNSNIVVKTISAKHNIHEEQLVYIRTRLGNHLPFSLIVVVVALLDAIATWEFGSSEREAGDLRSIACSLSPNDARQPPLRPSPKCSQRPAANGYPPPKKRASLKRLKKLLKRLKRSSKLLRRSRCHSYPKVLKNIQNFCANPDAMLTPRCSKKVNSFAANPHAMLEKQTRDWYDKPLEPPPSRFPPRTRKTSSLM